ncbi:hypothetical protein ABZU75_16900 [Streptosporangium sp. NPDC005286]
MTGQRFTCRAGPAEHPGADMAEWAWQAEQDRRAGFGVPPVE